jgi:hypothetical protein
MRSVFMQSVVAPIGEHFIKSARSGCLVNSALELRFRMGPVLQNITQS